jgi:hypothetical protein
MAILTYVGIGLLCLGYLGLIFVSLSSKPEPETKKRKSIRSSTSIAVNQTKNHRSNPSRSATSG